MGSMEANVPNHWGKVQWFHMLLQLLLLMLVLFLIITSANLWKVINVFIQRRFSFC